MLTQAVLRALIFQAAKENVIFRFSAVIGM